MPGGLLDIYKSDKFANTIKEKVEEKDTAKKTKAIKNFQKELNLNKKAFFAEYAMKNINDANLSATEVELRELKEDKGLKQKFYVDGVESEGRTNIAILQLAAKDCINKMLSIDKDSNIGDNLKGKYNKKVRNEGVDGLVGPNTLEVFTDIGMYMMENKGKAVEYTKSGEKGTITIPENYGFTGIVDNDLVRFIHAMCQTGAEVVDKPIPVEDTDIPAENTDIPAENTDIPAENTDIPAENTDIPAENTDKKGVDIKKETLVLNGNNIKTTQGHNTSISARDLIIPTTGKAFTIATDKPPYIPFKAGGSIGNGILLIPGDQNISNDKRTVDLTKSQEIIHIQTEDLDIINREPARIITKTENYSTLKGMIEATGANATFGDYIEENSRTPIAISERITNNGGNIDNTFIMNNRNEAYTSRKKDRTVEIYTTVTLN